MAPTDAAACPPVRSRSAGRSPPTRPLRDVVRAGSSTRHARARSLRPPRGRRPAPGARLLVPLPRRHRAQPGRAHPHRAGAGRARCRHLRPRLLPVAPLTSRYAAYRTMARGGPRPRGARRRLHLRAAATHETLAALPDQPRPPQDCPPTCRPPRRLPVGRHLRRPRGREQLGGRRLPARRRGLQRAARFLAAAGRRLPGLLRAPAAAAPQRPSGPDLLLHRRLDYGDAASTSTCSTPASTAPTSSPRRSPAARRTRASTTPRAPSSATSRSAGSSTASTARAPGGTCWRSRRSWRRSTTTVARASRSTTTSGTGTPCPATGSWASSSSAGRPIRWC